MFFRDYIFKGRREKKKKKKRGPAASYLKESGMQRALVLKECGVGGGVE